MERHEDEALAGKEISGYNRSYDTRRWHSALDYLTPREFEDIKHAPGEVQDGPRRPKSGSSRA